MSLTPQYRTMLMDASKIDEEVARERGYCALPTPAAIQALGFSRAQGKTAPALGIPLWDVHGTQRDWQIRPDAPRTDRSGKPIKYETPKGHHLFLDVHPRMQPHLGNPTIPLWMTEGIRKEDALTSQGACTIGLFGGVWGFRGTNEHGGKVILADWNHVALNGRHVYIAYDSDAMHKDNVHQALRALCTFLRSRQAHIAWVVWPEALGQQKVGADDFFAQGHTLEDLLALMQDDATHRHNGHAPTPPPGPPALPILDPAADLGTVSPCTHVVNGHRIARSYPETLRYVLGEGWILWTGTFWRPDPTRDDALALGHVRTLAGHIATEAAALYTLAAQAVSPDDRKALYALAEERGRWAAQSEYKGTLTASLAFAKDLLLLPYDKINTDPWLFNVHNGTVNLQTGELQSHTPGDYITHQAPVTYDPQARCPRWLRFLLEVFARDKAMVRFVQRAIGWSLTGVVQDRALFFLYGAQGHNGKTTLVEAIRDLMGTAGEGSFGYARKVDVATFMHSRNSEENQRKAAGLTGARFIYSSEIGEDQRLNEQLIKDMTGGDTLEARKLYREAFNFKPQFKPWMYGNHKPEVRGTDDALWSRVKLVEFPVSFADRVDLTLPGRLREELPGILNWALAGCLAWQKEGLRPPDKVKIATEIYRKEQDVIGQFIEECCQTGQSATGRDYACKASLLYRAYQGWADENGSYALSQKRFGGYLTAHGYPSDDNASGEGARRLRIGLTDFGVTLAETPTLSPTLRDQRVGTTSASNGAAKSDSDSSQPTLPTLETEKSRDPIGGRGVSDSKGRKGREEDLKSEQHEQNQDDREPTHRNERVGERVGAPCPHEVTTTEPFPDGTVLVRCAKCKKIIGVQGVGT
jgi:putative DNA primase/helicase